MTLTRPSHCKVPLPPICLGLLRKSKRKWRKGLRRGCDSRAISALAHSWILSLPTRCTSTLTTGKSAREWISWKCLFRCVQSIYLKPSSSSCCGKYLCRMHFMRKKETCSSFGERRCLNWFSKGKMKFCWNLGTRCKKKFSAMIAWSSFFLRRCLN